MSKSVSLCVSMSVLMFFFMSCSCCMNMKMDRRGQVLIHNGTLKNGALHNGMLQKGTLHNGTLQYGTLQNVTALQSGTVTKRYIVIKQYIVERGDGNYDSTSLFHTYSKQAFIARNYTLYTTRVRCATVRQLQKRGENRSPQYLTKRHVTKQYVTKPYTDMIVCYIGW
jgi:hypothetical protein